MQQLVLHHHGILNGKMNLKKLNFLFVFQVNCPGCFLYGIPLVNKLFKEFGEQLSFLGISTAFEDFQYNTTENTELVVFKNQLIGETKKAFADQGLDHYPYAIDFPVAMDQKADASFDYTYGAEVICQIHPDYQLWSDFEKVKLQKKVKAFLQHQEEISLTFTLNQLRGTPTMLVYNEAYEVLFSKFGHVDYPTMAQNITSLIDRFN